ncbi:MAG TPA: nitroreductase family protein, partial [Dongiaceae bacterium]|nr:nitroreductase family protein [Dongiaceae bacterium]
ARRHGDGVTVESLDCGVVASVLAGSYFDPGSSLLRFGAESAARKARSAIRSAGALVLITASAAGRAAWVNAGQAYERLALRATTLGIAQQILHAPIEIERFRGDLLRVFGAPGEDPVLLVRLGHASRPAPSVRRSVSQVASFRLS